MKNVSFDGMTGRVQIDQSGDMKESLRAMNYVLEGDRTMHGKQIGVYSALDRQYSAVQHDVIWPGGCDVVPFAWLSCQVGAYLVQQSRCTPCLPGSASVGGTVTACMQCSAGMRSAAASFGPACRLSRMLDPNRGVLLLCDQVTSSLPRRSSAASAATASATSTKKAQHRQCAKPALRTRANGLTSSRV